MTSDSGQVYGHILESLIKVRSSGSSNSYSTMNKKCEHINEFKQYQLNWLCLCEYKYNENRLCLCEHWAQACVNICFYVS